MAGKRTHARPALLIGSRRSAAGFVGYFGRYLAMLISWPGSTCSVECCKSSKKDCNSNRTVLETILGSNLRAKVLGWLFTHTDQCHFVRQLARLVGEDSTNVSGELNRLAKTGILVCIAEGKQKYYQANRSLRWKTARA